MKKKIYFLAPKTKWWTYFYYKNIVDFLQKNYSKEYDIIFCNSFFDYLMLHFKKADTIFSIIPFIFKPIRAKKYIFNLHWNYEIEKKNKGLWVKLLYLAPLNLWFSDTIMLTSYYLADKLDFRKKYKNKIEIVSNFVEEITEKNKHLEKNNNNFLTITSFKFYKKWKGILNLWEIIKKIGENQPKKNIIFSIIWNDESENWKKIMDEFNTINFSKNVKIQWKWWLSKTEIKQEFLAHNTFLYWSELDNTPWVILDAINYDLRVFVNNFESFKYFLPEEIICKDEEEMVKKIKENTKISAKLQSLNEIARNIVNLF